MSTKNDMIWASGHYLGENFPDDYDKWTEDKIYQFCEDHCWEPLKDPTVNGSSNRLST